MVSKVCDFGVFIILFKLLADGKLYAADADTNIIPDIN